MAGLAQRRCRSPAPGAAGPTPRAPFESSPRSSPRSRLPAGRRGDSQALRYDLRELALLEVPSFVQTGLPSSGLRAKRFLEGQKRPWVSIREAGYQHGFDRCQQRLVPGTIGEIRHEVAEPGSRHIDDDVGFGRVQAVEGPGEISAASAMSSTVVSS